VRASRTTATAVGALLLALLCAGPATAASTADVYRDADGSIRLQNAKGFDGTGSTVALIDTGVANVPALSGVVVHQENFSAAPDDGDQFGHGTFVAGVIHANAPGAKIVSLKLSGADGSVDVTQVLAALQWCVDNKAQYNIRVINLSMGSDSQQSWRVSPLNFAVEKAWDAGIVVVVAAGNAGPMSGTVTKPADDPLAISVGASDDQGTGDPSDDWVTAFDSRGPTTDGLAKPDIVAPGMHIESLRDPGSTIDTAYPNARVGDSDFLGSGTSFAAPMVSGIVAQLLQSDPSLTPDQIKYALLNAATPINGDPSAQGYGTVRGLRTLNSLHTGTANHGVGRSDGSGSVDADRGSMDVTVQVQVTQSDGTVDTEPVSVHGNATAMVHRSADANPFDGLDTFNQTQYDTSGWGASQWGASQWDASQWDASQWGASQWGASQWGASQWGASQWWASQWG
jgi:serine protease AprX